MTRNNRKPRPKADFERELVEQVSLLRASCAQYDQGLEAVGKHIALSLRVLLHHRGQSRALLEQLGLRDGWFYASAPPLNPRNLLSECNLVVMHLSGQDGRYVPLCSTGGGPWPPQRIRFVDWWNAPVCKDTTGAMFCRRELVQHVADTDGGAHVDPELDEHYMRLSRENGLGWIFGNGSVERAFSGRPELACMRQISFEVLTTLEERAAKYLGIPPAGSLETSAKSGTRA